MARVSTSPPAAELYLIQGELPETRDLDDARLACGAPELSAGQLRTYVVRLGRHLATTAVPARLVSEPRRGYGVVFTT